MNVEMDETHTSPPGALPGLRPRILMGVSLDVLPCAGRLSRAVPGVLRGLLPGVLPGTLPNVLCFPRAVSRARGAPPIIALSMKKIMSRLILLALATLAMLVPAGAGRAADAFDFPDFPQYLKTVETIRGLTFTGPVAKARQSPRDFRRFVRGEIDRDLPAPRAGCTARALGLLGLLPERFDLRQAYEDILLGQVAAYYNPLTGTFYIVQKDLPPEVLKPTVLHELAHALQDQRFALEKRMDALRGVTNEDAENAFRFLAEGEATYVMTLGTLRDAGIAPDRQPDMVDRAVGMTAGLGREAVVSQMKELASMLDPELAGTVDELGSVPEYLFRTLLAPYSIGQRAVHLAYRRGGWAAVNDLWKNPPSSTELFLHPEKLAETKRDEPVKVAVPDISSALGAGYAPACENTLGELGTEIALEETLPAAAPGERDPIADTGSVASAGGTSDEKPPGAPKKVETKDGTAPKAADQDAAGARERIRNEGNDSTNAGGGASDAKPPDAPAKVGAREGSDANKEIRDRAARAASGWGGDRYRVFEKKGRGTVVVWRTVWDTEGDAGKFADALWDTFAKRLPGGSGSISILDGASSTSDRAASELHERQDPGPAGPFSPRNLYGLGIRVPAGDPAVTAALLIARRQKEVTFIAGATAAQARAALAALDPFFAYAGGEGKAGDHPAAGQPPVLPPLPQGGAETTSPKP